MCNVLTTCCCVAGCCPGTMGSKGVRLMYAVMFLLTTIVAWTMRSGRVQQALEDAPDAFKLDCGVDLDCYGNLGVYRIMLGMLLFFAIMMFVTLGTTTKGSFQAWLHNGWWLLKVVLWITLIIACFFIEADDLDPFQYVAIIGAAIFVLIQLVLLVDLAHSIAEGVRKRSEEGGPGNKWLPFMAILTVLLMAGIMTLTVLSYIYFAPEADCSLNIFFVTFNLILIIIMVILSVHPKVQKRNPYSGILQPSIVGLYTSYLVWSALASEPLDERCNGLESPNSATNTSVVLGVMITFIAIIWGILRTGSQKDNLLGKDEKMASDTEENAAALDDPVEYNYSTFHFIFSLGVMYMACVLTGWNEIDESGGSYRANHGWAAVWVQITFSWICSLIYTWTLIAPLLFPNRDFS